ncbi:ABC-type xenobiotic transporter, partial [Sarracenia purpurea var. burkii]
MNNRSSQRLLMVSRSSSRNSAALSQILEIVKVQAEKEFPVPSFRRLLAMNLPEWKQAIMGDQEEDGDIRAVFSRASGVLA